MDWTKGKELVVLRAMDLYFPYEKRGDDQDGMR
jgi:hypothetical protein